MTQSEIAEAAERLANDVSTAILHWERLPTAIRYDPEFATTESAMCGLLQSIEGYVAARLAQEREDAEPITPAALWRAGANEGECHTDFEKEFAFWTQGDHDCSDGVILYVRRTGANVPYFARVSDDDGFGVMLDKPLKTMGDVFRLCDDFGIKLEALKGTP